MAVYTVHRRTGGVGDDTVLIKEGFCWPAFLFTVPWALWHRLWAVALGLAVSAGLLDLALEALGAGVAASAAVWLGYLVLIGYAGNDLRRRGLARRGYREPGLVSGPNPEAAMRRLFDRSEADTSGVTW